RWSGPTAAPTRARPSPTATAPTTASIRSRGMTSRARTRRPGITARRPSDSAYLSSSKDQHEDRSYVRVRERGQPRRLPPAGVPLRRGRRLPAGPGRVLDRALRGNQDHDPVLEAGVADRAVAGTERDPLRERRFVADLCPGARDGRHLATARARGARRD